MKTLRLNAGDVSSLILLSAVAWTAAGRKLIYSPVGDCPSLYSDLHGPARRIADVILATHSGDVFGLKRGRAYARTAWAFIKNSVYRRDSLPPDEFAREVRKLRRIERRLKIYLP